MTIRAERRPIDMQEIQEHDMKYMDIKKDNNIRKKAEIEIAEEEDEMRRDDLD